MEVKLGARSSFTLVFLFCSVKQEPPDVPVMKKAEPMFKSPPLPEPDLLPDLLQAWSRCKEEEFLFMQLPDSLPGQPPTSDARPTKTTVQSEDGQNMLQKAEGQVRVYFLSVYSYV